ncbi:MAG TPA: TIGR03808 family TAT-translocated repetitive protein [Roseiarcus sp.]|nr:TIGR03808 family TAT-translocated repetitive protein [Roseiarcus sp.]
MIDRRSLVAGALALPALWRTRGAAGEALPDAQPALQRAINEAQRGRGVVTIPPGVSRVSQLKIAGDVRLVGAARASRLLAAGPGPLLTIEKAQSVTIENIAFDGGGRAPGGDAGLIEARDTADLRLSDCAIASALGDGLRTERCGGRIERNVFRALSRAALHSLDSTGLAIVDNHIEDCGANGVELWRSSPGYDGSILRGNRIELIRADPGGDGPYGNAISVFRAGGVSTSGNVIRQTAFSAIRYNLGSDALIADNNCFDIGETAIYVEFGAQGAIVSSNIVDGASTGISVTNFDRGGRLATVSGNVLRNLVKPLPQGGEIYGIGIHVEADTTVTGNALDNANFAGLKLGYGVGLRDVVAVGNAISDCGFGVAVSVAPGAGGATIRDNRIARARRGAIVGMAWEKVVSADLVAEAANYPLLTIAGNDVR